MDGAVGRTLFPSPFQGRGHRACRRLGRTASTPAHGALADRSPPAPAPPRCPKRPFTRQPGHHRRRPRRSRFYRSRLYNGPACTPSLRGAQPLATQSGAWLPYTTCTYLHMHVHAHARTCTCTGSLRLWPVVHFVCVARHVHGLRLVRHTVGVWCGATRPRRHSNRRVFRRHPSPHGGVAGYAARHSTELKATPLPVGPCHPPLPVGARHPSALATRRRADDRPPACFLTLHPAHSYLDLRLVAPACMLAFELKPPPLTHYLPLPPPPLDARLRTEASASRHQVHPTGLVRPRRHRLLPALARAAGHAAAAGRRAAALHNPIRVVR